jgi:hemerythrin superfamily protein
MAKKKAKSSNAKSSKGAKKTTKKSSAGSSKKKSAGRSGGKMQAKTDPADIIQLILQDHKPLKVLIKLLKDGAVEFREKQPAFMEFAPLLISHAKPEEQSLYMAMKKNEDLRSEGLEGDTEHAIADQLVEEIRRTNDEDTWMAKVKVLAELVEHHIQEEEEEMLPDYRKESGLEDRIQIGQVYLQLKEQMEAQGGDDAPSEVNSRGSAMSNEKSKSLS